MMASALAFGSLFAAACGGSSSNADGGNNGDPDAGVPTGAIHQYVGNTLDVPSTPQESQALGLNLDGDPQNRPDNLLGQILSTLAQQGVDIQMQIDESVVAGDLIILHEVQTDDFTTWPNAGWQVYLGQWTGAEPPTFDGTETFTVDPAGPTDAVLAGSISGGQFTGGPAEVTIQIALVEGAPPLVLDLIGARIQSDVTATSCDGKLGGAITQDDINTKVIPAVADMMNTNIADNCPGMTCPKGSSSQTIIDLFDVGIECDTAEDCPAAASTCDATDMVCTCGGPDCGGHLAGDYVITDEELINNDLIASILSPDVDLLDADGNFNPRQDMVEDSVSLGVGFTCVPATF
jgi:hypothetical protein